MSELFRHRPYSPPGPRFYLHVCNGSGFVEDEEGLELADVKAARARAVEGLRDIMAAELLKGEINMASFIEIEDEGHTLLDTVQFLDAVDMKTERSARRVKEAGLLRGK